MIGLLLATAMAPGASAALVELPINLEPYTATYATTTIKTQFEDAAKLKAPLDKIDVDELFKNLDAFYSNYKGKGKSKSKGKGKYDQSYSSYQGYNQNNSSKDKIFNTTMYNKGLYILFCVILFVW